MPGVSHRVHVGSMVNPHRQRVAGDGRRLWTDLWRLENLRCLSRSMVFMCPGHILLVYKYVRWEYVNIPHKPQSCMIIPLVHVCTFRIVPSSRPGKLLCDD